MLGLLLVYFIGKKFYELAIEQQKSRWGYAIAGVISYYLGTFIAGILLAIFMELVLERNIEEMDDFAISLLALPFGLAASWAFYLILQKNANTSSPLNSDVLDEEML
ncbi:MAG: hypothetical protein KDC53_24305 [Saprospiraceae bacterium]|nr:hypothetical protein [Saprospiraceae bacterium]